MNTEKWELLRAFYDEMGLLAIEGESGGKFERCMEAIKKKDDYRYLIGVKHEHKGNTSVQVILEGKKEVLEYVLGLVQRLKKENQV